MKSIWIILSYDFEKWAERTNATAALQLIILKIWCSYVVQLHNHEVIKYHVGFTLNKCKLINTVL